MTTAILGDWGTSRLRLWRMEGDRLLDRADGPGIGALSGPALDALTAALAPWRDLGHIGPIRLCGMAGSRTGVQEAPYLDCPANLEAWRKSGVSLRADGLDIFIASGMACADSEGAPDVMRGEETQIFGALRLNPTLSMGRRTLLLPGTHSKWARVEDGRITGFRTWITGELFALLTQRSALTRLDGAPADAAVSQSAFEHGLARAKTNDLGGSLFEARSAQLRLGRSPDWARHYLSGLLIGREVVDALNRLDDSDNEIIIIGDPALASRYQTALAQVDLKADLMDGDACVLAGLLQLTPSEP